MQEVHPSGELLFDIVVETHRGFAKKCP